MSRRALVAVADGLDRSQRLDLLVHALAQLPDELTLHVLGDGHGRADLARLAQAYGIAERLSIGTAPPADVHAVAVHAAGPRRAPADALTLDPTRATDTEGRRVATMAEFLECVTTDQDAPAACREHDEILRGHRIALFSTVPAPYRIALFNGIAARLARVDARFRVLYLARSAGNRPWVRLSSEMRFDYRVLRSAAIPVGHRRPLVPLDLEIALARFRPTLVIAVGFSPLMAGRAALYANARRIPFGVWSGELAARRTAQSSVRRPLRVAVARRAQFAVAYGFLAGEYLRSLRASLPVVYVRNSSAARARDRSTGRRAGGPVRLLAVADLALPGKGIDTIIDALALVPDLDCGLTVIGGGPADPFRRRAAGDPRVDFTGPLAPAQVIDAYRTADVYLFPSTIDVFGLSLVEAMSTGLACVASSESGAVADLCVDGRNAIVIDDRSPESWARAIGGLAADPDRREELAAAAARTIRNRWSIQHSVDAWIAGFRLGLLSRVPAEVRR